MTPTEIDIEAIRADAVRVGAVIDCGLLDTPPEESFDHLTQLAKKVTGAPIAYFCLLDAARDYYKSSIGFPEALSTIRQVEGRTFCHYTLRSGGPLVVDDALLHAEYRDIPMVTSLGARAYVGVPLRTDAGHQIGSFSVMDLKPRNWAALEVDLLVDMARSVMRELQLRSLIADAKRSIRLAEEEAIRREQIIANIAHDLRSPLQTLTLTFEMATQANSIPLRREKAAGLFNQASATMNQMLENLLAAPAESQWAAKPVQAASLVNDALGIMQPIAEQKSIHLQSYCDRGLPPISVDYQRVLRVFSNLVGNAIKFSPVGSQIVVDATEEADRFVRFSIVDVGPGISKDHQRRIFDRHWKSDDGSLSGKGLGLSIAKEIVEDLGGTIGVSSAPGGGSEFFFTLPLFERRVPGAGREGPR